MSSAIFVRFRQPNMGLGQDADYWISFQRIMMESYLRFPL